MTLELDAAAQSAGLDPRRAAEVITTRPGGADGRGSGYLVAERTVLTAAHVVASSTGVRVRFNADRPGQWEARVEVVWTHTPLDIAVLRIVEHSAGPPGAASSPSPVRYARVVRPPVECETLGFPLFKLRRDPDPKTLRSHGRPSQYRDAEHAVGWASSWANAREGTMSVHVNAPELDPQSTRSPWEGMSGAAVFSGGRLIGVIGRHHLTDGPGTLAAYPVDSWYQRLEPESLTDLKRLIHLPDMPEGLADLARAGPEQAGRPRQLPATTSAFAGRERELEQLFKIADAVGGPGAPGAVMISAVNGMPGIGKTALAVHAAHQLAGRFPDGQLFTDLHGYTEDTPPREPGDVLAAFLDALGVPLHRIPPDIEDRAALYRARLFGTRTLILLDNAATEAQVRPLLPGGGGCLVMVTSRRRLRALDDIQALTLDVPSEAEAVEILRHIVGADRAAASDPQLGQLAELCGKLPLALSMTAGLIRHRPAWSLQDLTEKLREQKPGLGAFSDGDRSLDAVFDLSYRSLSAEQQLLYRRLGLTTRPDIDVEAAAALLNSGLAEAERLLQSLIDHNILSEPARGRYRLHDLIRAHAGIRAKDDPQRQGSAARARLTANYQREDVRDEADLRARLIDHATRDLAGSMRVEAEWEIKQLGLLHPSPLDVRWRRVVRTSGSANPASQHRVLTSPLSKIADVYLGGWSEPYGRRVVILGGSGSGKTTVALFLQRELCARRQADGGDYSGPVPFLLSLDHWTPGTDPLAWAARRLEAMFPRFARPLTRGGEISTTAERLLEEGRVLLILEVEDGTPLSLVRKAISAINDRLHRDTPLILTCDPQTYASCLADGVVVGLQPPTVDAVKQYLGAGAPLDAWRPVFDHLDRHPHSSMARTLQSPQMVWLTRRRYGSDPRALVERLGGPQLPRADELFDHLIGEFVRLVFGRETDGPWTADRAERWAVFLARWTRDRRNSQYEIPFREGTLTIVDDGHAIDWWRLAEAPGVSVFSRVGAGIIGGLTTGGAVGLAVGCIFWKTADHQMVLLGSSGLGLLAALAMGRICAVSRPWPTSVQVAGPRRWRAPILAGVAVSILAASAGAIMAGGRYGLCWGPVIALPIAVSCAFTQPFTEIDTAPTPVAHYRADMTRSAMYAVAYGVAAGVFSGVYRGALIGIVMGALAGTAGGLTYGAVFKIAFGRGGVPGLAAWLRFRLAHFRLAAAGLLPWRLFSFLGEARRRGVLRQSGPVLHLRHISLQEQLYKKK